MRASSPWTQLLEAVLAVLACLARFCHNSGCDADEAASNCLYVMNCSLLACLRCVSAQQGGRVEMKLHLLRPAWLHGICVPVMETPLPLVLHCKEPSLLTRLQVARPSAGTPVRAAIAVVNLSPGAPTLFPLKDAPRLLALDSVSASDIEANKCHNRKLCNVYLLRSMYPRCNLKAGFSAPR